MFSLKDSFDDYFEHLNNPTVKIPTGVGTIDQLIGGGIRKKAMTLFIAPPNSGKSLAKCSIATNMALSGIKALYVSLEMDEFMVLGRLLCNLFDYHVSFENFSQSYKSYNTPYNNECIKKATILNVKDKKIDLLDIKPLLGSDTMKVKRHNVVISVSKKGVEKFEP